nr:MAG TPA: hypothetical protein [Bacteriophage sp.]
MCRFLNTKTISSIQPVFILYLVSISSLSHNI